MIHPGQIIKSYPNVCNIMKDHLKNAFDGFGNALSTLNDLLSEHDCDFEQTANILMTSSEALAEIDVNSDELVNNFFSCREKIRDIRNQLRAKDEKFKKMAKRLVKLRKREIKQKKLLGVRGNEIAIKEKKLAKIRRITKFVITEQNF